MKRITPLSIAILFTFAIWAQQQWSPNMSVRNLNQDEEPVRISELKIDVKVVGSLSVTTVDMTFYNPNGRVLEGELTFPLADGQSISRYALDINGKLREGVVVDKAKGQKAFESVVRRGVDPGLLEKTEGNNFRTRVYPLLANSTRRVVIAYEQELMPDNGSYRFFLPMEYHNTLDYFSLNVSVFGNDLQPKAEKSPWGAFTFDRSGAAYNASFTEKNYLAKGQLVFSIPVKEDIQQFTEKGKISGQTVFYTQLFPEVTQSPKKIPKKIALYWDNSASMAKRNYEMEAQLLEKYFVKANSPAVDFSIINVEEVKLKSIPAMNDANWVKLWTMLMKYHYDGATQLGALDFTKIDADEILLFTDGISNLGKKVPKLGKIPVTTVNSCLSADYSMLRYISSTTGGAYINLAQQTVDEALQLLTTESPRLISIEYNKKEIDELTTSGFIIDPKKGLSLAGKLLVDKAKIKLNFGTGNRVSYSQTVTIDRKDIADYGNMVERLWAAKRISELDMLYDKNREKIEKLGRTYNIVTRNTSLIVLETALDYFQHDITPPEELLEEYNDLKESAWERKKNHMEEHVERMIWLFAHRKIWWETKYPLKGAKPAVKDQSTPPRTQRTEPLRTPTRGQYTVTGIIKDSQGEPIIGATIVKKNKPGLGTMSDVNGEFTIRVNNNDILIFTYIGCEPREVTVTGNQTLEVIMEENQDQLDEVVVVAFGAQRKETIIGAITTVNVEELKAPSGEISNMLAGSVPGLLLSENEKSSADHSGQITLKGWQSDAPYMDTLRKAMNTNRFYNVYLEMKDQYGTAPSFYLDVAALLEEDGKKEDAFLALSNLVEISLEDYRLLRVLAHKYKHLGYTEYAVELFEKVLELRPEEPQSYRDLGLAYAQNKQYQKAIDMLYRIFDQEWDRRFPEIELFAAEEINNIIARAEREGVKLDISKIDERLLFNMPLDIRIVLSWDTDNSDMDLWVFDPDGEKCFYRNQLTRLGGIMTKDFTGGYGPEEFLIRNAKKGKYTIQADYYGSREQTLIGPTTIYVDIYTHYGTAKETKKTITLRLEKDQDEVEIGDIVF